MCTIKGYDDHIFRFPEPLEIGMEDGDRCNRYPEEDEDAPRGYVRKPCKGIIFIEDGFLYCDVCYELVK